MSTINITLLAFFFKSNTSFRKGGVNVADINKYEHITDAIEYVKDFPMAYYGSLFKFQTEYLDDISFNNTIENIQVILNLIYENCRVLEDINNYAKSYIKDNINTITKECYEILNSIENNVDSLRQDNFVSVNVPFENGTGSFLDRDNTVLPQNAIYKNNITLSYKREENIRIDSISTSAPCKPYNSNISDLLNGKEYRVFYLIDAPAEDGFKEKITITFNEEREINFLNIITSNCNIEGVIYRNNNSDNDYMLTEYNLIHYPRKVKTIDIILKCDTYDTVTYSVDKKCMKDNFLEKVTENEYNKLVNGKPTLTVGEIDELAGITAYRRAYEIYVQALNNWKEQRQVVATINQMNGYQDEVPEIQMVESNLSSGDINKNEIKNTPMTVQKNSLMKPEYLPDDIYRSQILSDKLRDINGNYITQ